MTDDKLRALIKLESACYYYRMSVVTRESQDSIDRKSARLFDCMQEAQKVIEKYTK